MVKYLPFLLLFGAAWGLSYVKEIDRLERDEKPARSGKRFVILTFVSLAVSFLFTLWSVDAGLILLTLSLYLFAVLAGIAAGQKTAWAVFCRRNPQLFEEE